jgi:hypothetical protein
MDLKLSNNFLWQLNEIESIPKWSLGTKNTLLTFSECQPTNHYAVEVE